METAALTIGFLMDPLEQVLVHHDTTFALMRAAQERGHRLLSFGQDALYHQGGQAHARAREVEVFEQQGHHFRVVAEREVPLGVLDVLWMRKDPPVDIAFLHATQLVDATGGRAPVYVNSPAGLRTANEKLWALHFPELTPRHWSPRPGAAPFLRRGRARRRHRQAGGWPRRRGRGAAPAW